MGVLLSKLNNFGNESITGSQTTAQKSSLKRKRVAQGNDERSSKKSRKSSLASSVNPSTNSPSIHKTICELSGQRTNECLDVNIILKAKGSKPHKSRRKKEAKDSEELSANNRDVEEAISSRIATAHEEECAIDTIKNSSATSENATPKPARRKRKAPKSPHFESMTQPVSTSPLPAAKTSDKSFDRKSKISIVETGPVPPLAHFRPTNPDEFGLIQEKLRHDPWKMLVAVIFLNVTTAKMALPLLAQLFERWPTPVALSSANFEELSQFLYPIGLYNTRAKRLIEFSTMWLTNPPCPDVLTKRKGLAKYPPTSISHLPGASLSLGHVDDRWVYMHLIHGECFVQVSMNGGTFSRWTKSYKHG